MGKIASIGYVCLLAVIFVMRLFYAHDPYYIHALLLALCLGYCWWKHPLRFTSVDVCLLGFWGCLGLLPSTNCLGTINSFFGFTAGLLFYFLVRTLNDKGKAYLLSVLAVCIAAVSLLALSQFAIFSRRVHEAGFASLYDFRALYQPLGVTINNWNALQWLFGGILLVAYRNSTSKWIRKLTVLTGGMVVCLSWLSFSRGMYLSGVLFVAGWIIIEGKRLFERKKIAIVVFYGILIAGMIAVYPKETLRVFQGNETLSQRRSTESRIKELDLVKRVLKEYPSGVGFGNYTLAKDYFLHGDERVETYTSYAMNIFFKVAVEGGYAGLFFFVLLLGAIVASLIRRRDKTAWLLFLFLFAFFVKEQTFATLLDSHITLLSVFVLLAFMQEHEDSMQGNKYIRWAAAAPALVWIGLFLVMQWTEHREQSVPKLIYKALKLRETNSQEAMALFGQARQQSPLDIQIPFYECETCSPTETLSEKESLLKRWIDDYPDKFQFQWSLYNLYRQTGDTERAKKIWLEAILQNPRLLETSYWQKLQVEEPAWSECVKAELLESIQKKPDDVIRLAKYGSVALQTGETELAEQYLDEANRLLPNLSRVWYNLAILMEQKGMPEKADEYRRKGNFIEQGVFVLQKDEESPVPAKEIDQFLDCSYPFLFSIWYRSDLLITDSIR